MTKRRPGPRPSSHPNKGLGGWKRRAFRLAAGVGVVGAVLALWAFVLEPSSLVMQEVDLAVPHLGDQRVRMAVLTDLHVGSPYHSLETLARIVERTNDAQPDIVVILGDLVIHGVIGGRFVPPEPIAAALGQLRAPGGVFAVLGNHDHWLNAEQVTAALEAAGIPVLVDASVPLRPPVTGVWIGGVSDFWEGPHDVTATLEAVPTGEPVILITHNPDVFPQVPARVSLTIAGHTHGGQVRFPFVGAPIVPSNFGQRFVEGHVEEDGRNLFVATGTGTSMLPVRFRVPPRITVLNLSGTDEP